MAVFVIGDIHGGLKALKQVLERAQIKNTDTLIFLGDYVDGWSDSVATLDYLISLKYNYKCIFLKGNHDDLLLQWLTLDIDNPMWLEHGGESTIIGYHGVSSDIKNKHISFLNQLKDFHLDNKNRLFIHAGFTNLKGITHEYYPQMFYWDRTLWELALAMDSMLTSESINYPKRLKCYSEIFIGHTPTTLINENPPVNRANVWNLDTGAAFKGMLTIMNIDTKEFWQSDPVFTLYPNEKGRN